MQLEKVRTQYVAYRIPGLVLTQEGTLLGYYESRRSGSDWADIDIKIVRSTDKGDHWETVKLIPSMGNTLNNPVMIVNGSRIHLLYLKNYKQLYHCVSTDDGRSFTEAREISQVFEQGGFFYNVAAVGPGHGIVHNGNLIAPIWFAENREDEKAHRPSFISTIYSTDDGETWQLGEIIGRDLFVDPSECALAVTADNKVLNSIRNENDDHNRGLAISENGYSGWQDVKLMPTLEDPVCQGSMDHHNKKVYHINCSSRNHRGDLTIKVSEDAFETYESIYVDEEGGYSDLAVTDDEIYVLYERDVLNDGLYFKRIAIRK